jgi:hypothetical protein
MAAFDQRGVAAIATPGVSAGIASDCPDQNPRPAPRVVVGTY